MKIFIFNILVVFTYGTFATYWDNYNYCKLPCNYGFGNVQHVKCERKVMNCSVNEYNCGKWKILKLSDKLKYLILSEHNKLRNKVALGHETRGVNGSQPPASNMMALKYNDELASIAQCWANTCQTTVHSKCHRGKNLPFAGQNMGARFASAENLVSNIEQNIKYIIKDWYKEVRYFNKDNIQAYVPISGTGHYTLQVWGNIQEIGCGLIKYYKNSWHSLFLVCNYGSKEIAGNVLGFEMYHIGKPCSACPKNTRCNLKYKGLCGEESLDLTEIVDKIDNKESTTTTTTTTTVVYQPTTSLYDDSGNLWSKLNSSFFLHWLKLK